MGKNNKKTKLTYRETLQDNKTKDKLILKLQDIPNNKKLAELEQLLKEIHKDYDKMKLDVVNQALEIVQLKKEKKKLKREKKELDVVIKLQKKGMKELNCRIKTIRSDRDNYKKQIKG